MRRLAAAAVLAAAGLLCAAAPPGFDWGLPRGVRPPPVPADNPMSAAKVELGRRLFYDGDLSVNGTIACSTCHDQRDAFAENNRNRPGVTGAPGRRNVMSLANVGYFKPLTWADPAQTTLEAQVAVPVFGDHPVEMGMKGQEAELVRRLASDACYRTMFAGAFPEARGEVSQANIAKALAAFERTLISRTAPYDRDELSPDARRGQTLFRARGCAACHSGPDFTDGRFHVIATPFGEDHGAAEKTGRAAHEGAFRTASLRNVDLTYPYLHDGSARTIHKAIHAHERAGAGVTQDEAALIETFLLTLTDRAFTKDPRFSLPRSFCGVPR